MIWIVPLRHWEALARLCLDPKDLPLFVKGCDGARHAVDVVIRFADVPHQVQAEALVDRHLCGLQMSIFQQCAVSAVILWVVLEGALQSGQRSRSGVQRF